MFLKIMPKLVLKNILGDYGLTSSLKPYSTIMGLTQKNFKTVVTNYGFDDNTLV